MSRKTLFFIVALLFIARIFYGLCVDFWYVDNIQIYLIGLKCYATGTWPWYGPDVIYAKSQIPGALQGLLVGLPFYVFPYPEAPSIFLNILTFSSLCFFAWYILKRVSGLPAWLVFIWLLTAPWLMVYSTEVVNPSYVFPFAILFFISVLELLPIYTTRHSGFDKRLLYYLHHADTFVMGAVGPF
jgi:hypothetical protein